MTGLLRTREKRVLRLTLDRGEQRNRLDGALCRSLAEALIEAEGDGSVGAVLLEAAGPVFSEGFASGEEGGEDTEAQTLLFGRTRPWLKPVVAAVQGPCLGAGLGLLAQAHIVIAAQGTQFGLTEIRLGGFPFITFPALVDVMGRRRALELALTGRLFSVSEAREFGLVHEICPAFELEDRAAHTVHHLASLSPAAVGSGLEFAAQMGGLGAARAQELAVRMAQQACSSADYAEGTAARRENRAPRWPSLTLRTPEEP